jgi:lipopolysaccharide transport system ATP-binding protein
MRSLVDRSGILVLASHSAELLARECNRRVELADGRIVGDRRIEPIQGSG